MVKPQLLCSPLIISRLPHFNEGVEATLSCLFPEGRETSIALTRKAAKPFRLTTKVVVSRQTFVYGFRYHGPLVPVAQLGPSRQNTGWSKNERYIIDR